MTARLENLTNRPVTVVLNSGAVLHLPPGHVAEPDPVEIEDNAKVRKLRDALVVSVTEAEKAKGAEATTKATGDDAARSGRTAKRRPHEDNQQ